MFASLFIRVCVCVSRLAHNESESNLNETQRRLTSRIGDLQKIQERNKLLDEKNGVRVSVSESAYMLVCFHMRVCVCVHV